MSTLRIYNKEFEPFLSRTEIAQAIHELASKINTDFAGKELVIVGVLDGAFMFLSDLMKELTINVTLEMVKLKSYEGESTTGHVRRLLGLSRSLRGRHVMIVEDIIDTGITLGHLMELLEAEKPASVTVTTLLLKEEVFKSKYAIDHFGFSIPNKFVVGYGMDYDGLGRQYPDIYAAIH
ncbi:hypoxanthine phosphoribosyltransferase [Marinoscillum furvescens]|uniref:Hypoxanthine phosphoribosyltransferase n=1 Tax=Marinoscillum furvescens DSM 4134 TaxID=1122208 RepID=A0A3D9L3B8_MARFU|nr:hypoxanthine phosphoribosyltransferase [Marinoscillum furvescens]RED99784.1 hypoxanthine phosphoribosyltransferase [Marinoscillum furvescens DSM 4134]